MLAKGANAACQLGASGKFARYVMRSVVLLPLTPNQMSLNKFKG